MSYRFIVSNSTDYVKANSYLNLEDASALIEALANRGDWDDFDDENRKILLINASLGVDGLMQYQGLPTDPDQILKFPRNGKKKIPLELEFAVVKFAVKLTGETTNLEIKRRRGGLFDEEYFRSTGAAAEIKKDPDVALFLSKYKMRTVVTDFQAR